MRNAFAQELIQLADLDPNLILLAGDIGFRIFDNFIEKFPERFINCGIAEQNMISVAAGLASEGKIPVVYTIIPFLVMRAYEQIRVDIGINNQNVILVGVGGGMAYDKLGSTHHACEDIALMRTISNLDVYTPIDPNNVRACLDQSYNSSKIRNKASYIRLSKGGENNFEKIKSIASNINLVGSDKITKNVLISHGNLCSKFLEFNKEEKIELSIILISKIDDETINNLSQIIENFEDESKVMFIEEHYKVGGLYEAISPNLLSISKKHIYANLCLEHTYTFQILSHDALLEKCGLDFKKVVSFFKQ